MRVLFVSPLTLLGMGLVLSISQPLAFAQEEKIDGNLLLAPDRVTEVDIKLPAEDWDKLCQQSRNMGGFFTGAAITKPFTYFKADISVDGKTIKSVGVRKKGLFGSADTQRPSLKIRFDKFVDQSPVDGLSRLTLNNNKQDTSLVSQFLTYKLFRDAGLHAPRSGFAKVTVNGKYLGIYTHVESVKKELLKRAFGNDSGNLYEGTLTDFYPKTVEKIEAKTNKKTNKKADVARLAKLLAAKGDLPLDELKQQVDVDDFFRFWAMEGLLRMWDGYAGNQNNFFYYVDPANGLGYFMPWGTDSSFSKRGGPFARFGGGGRPTSIYAQSMLANRLYNTKGMPDRYRKTMLSLLTDVWKEKELIAEIDRLEKLLTPHLGRSQRSAGRSMDDVRDFIEARRDVVEKELADWPAQVEDMPRKPMYTVPVGSVAGSFEGSWQNRQPRNAAESGKAEVTVKLDGESIAFKQMGAGVWPTAMRRRFGPPRPGGNRKSVDLVLTGIRKSDDQQLTISLTVDREKFENTKADAPLDVTGRLSEGRGGFGAFGGFGGRGPMRSINGSITLSKAGTKAEEAVVGKVDLTIVEVRGGFFDRRRSRR